MSQDSAIKERALNYLLAGATQEQTAKALGVEPSTISYFLSTDVEFSDAISTADIGRRQKHNKTDDLADEIEFMLLENLKTAAGGLYKPMEIAKVYSLVNKGVRRGTTAPAGVTNNNQQIIQLNLPAAMLQKLQMTQQSQVVRAGDQDLVTVQSGTLRAMAERFQANSGGLSGAQNVLSKEISSPHPGPNQLPSPTRPAHDAIATTTINGVAAAKQAVSRLNASAIAGSDKTAEALGFGS